MLCQDRRRDTAHAARHRTDTGCLVHDRLIIHVPAQIAVFIYIDPDVYHTAPSPTISAVIILAFPAAAIRISASLHVCASSFVLV